MTTSVLPPRQLFRGVLPSDTVPSPISPAGLQASRLAAGPQSSYVFSSATSVYSIRSSPTKKRPRSELEHNPTSNHPTSHSDQPDTSIVSSAISDDYIVPLRFAFLSATRDILHSAHQTEIQSVAADDARIATVDAFGRCIVTLESESEQQPSHPHRERSSYIIPPVTAHSGCPAWAGVALSPDQSATAAVCRQFFQDLTIFDADVPVRTVYNLLPPASLSFASQLGAIVVAEGGDIAIYDVRVQERGGLAGRKKLSANILLSTDVSPDASYAAVAGADRVVQVFDVRGMNVRDRWQSCLKYECAGVLLSHDIDGMVYACSVDNEVACGAWSAQTAHSLRLGQDRAQSAMISGANTKSVRRAFGFRADVRITGMARRSKSGRCDYEEVCAITESGAFYLMRPSTQETQ